MLDDTSERRSFASVFAGVPSDGVPARYIAAAAKSCFAATNAVNPFPTGSVVSFKRHGYERCFYGIVRGDNGFSVELTVWGWPGFLTIDRALCSPAPDAWLPDADYFLKHGDKGVCPTAGQVPPSWLDEEGHDLRFASPSREWEYPHAPNFACDLARVLGEKCFVSEKKAVDCWNAAVHTGVHDLPLAPAYAYGSVVIYHRPGFEHHWYGTARFDNGDNLVLDILGFCSWFPVDRTLCVLAPPVWHPCIRDNIAMNVYPPAGAVPQNWLDDDGFDLRWPTSKRRWTYPQAANGACDLARAMRDKCEESENRVAREYKSVSMW